MQRVLGPNLSFQGRLKAFLFLSPHLQLCFAELLPARRQTVQAALSGVCSGDTTPAIVLVPGPGGEEDPFADLSEPAGWRRRLLSSAAAQVCKQEDKMGAPNRFAGPTLSSTAPDVSSFLGLVQMDLVTARLRHR